MLDITGPQQESFVPVSRFALLDYLADANQWPQEAVESISRFFSYLASWKHEAFVNRLIRMKAAYLVFSPDRDTVRILNYTDDERAALQKTLIADLSALLKMANYTALSRTDLESIFQKNSAHGLELTVDLSEYEEMMLFYRGRNEVTLETRNWKTLFLKRNVVKSRQFQRLFLMLKLKPEKQRLAEIMADGAISEKRARRLLHRNRKALPETSGDDCIYLKLFKNIPEMEMEMLFPNTKVALKPFDKLKLGITAGGGTGASIFATATKFTAAANPLTAAAALAGLGGVIFRQVSKIFVQRNKYSMMLAQKLFFHNLANNRSALTLLSDRAEEEEIKAAILSYFFIAQGGYRAANIGQLSKDIEELLEKQFGVKVIFDAEDPVTQLISDGIVEDQSGMLVAVPLTAATARLRNNLESALDKRDVSLAPIEA